jgi:hypothetical protein
VALAALAVAAEQDPEGLAFFGNSIPRVSNISTAQFTAWVAAGQPLVIGDATRGMQLEGWSCESMSLRFPQGRMRREYDWEQNPDDVNTQSIGDTSWISRSEQGLGSPGEALSPRAAPFYWGLRSATADPASVGGQAVVDEIMRLMDSPYFADPRPRNLASMKENSEFW